MQLNLEIGHNGLDQAPSQLNPMRKTSICTS
uniref:Uncharacterized protein n=1 Tax=Rhizophora mucronata TaxID=61149 RepID=A0A2P2Q4T8_RHIMU